MLILLVWRRITIKSLADHSVGQHLLSNKYQRPQRFTQLGSQITNLLRICPFNDFVTTL